MTLYLSFVLLTSQNPTSRTPDFVQVYKRSTGSVRTVCVHDFSQDRRICKCRTKSLYGQSVTLYGIEQTKVTRKSQARVCQIIPRRLPVEARTGGCHLCLIGGILRTQTNDRRTITVRLTCFRTTTLHLLFERTARQEFTNLRLSSMNVECLSVGN